MRYILFFLLFLLFLNTSIIKPAQLLHNEKIIFGIVSTIALVVIGKVLCTAYYDYLWPNKSMIKYCQTSFKIIHDTIRNYNSLYTIDAQLNDAQLKGKILMIYSSNPYPFMTYHSTIIEALYQLNNHLHDVQQSLRRITYRQQCIIKNSSKEEFVLLKIFNQLKKQALQLKISLKNTISLFEVLKHRISLFPEYIEDYYNWKEDQRIEEDKIHDTWPHEIQDNTQNDEQHYLEQQILNFHFDYY